MATIPSRRQFLSVLTLGPLAVRCHNPSDDAFDRNAMLTVLADNVFVPLARATAETQRALAHAIETFTNAPNGESLTQTRSAWRRARRPLKRAQAYSAGPMETLRIRSALDWPGDAQAVERALAGTNALTEATVEKLGANQRGMPAMEYLLFARDDTETLEAFSSTPDASRRRALLRAIGGYGAARAEAFAAAWDRMTGDYAGQLSRAGRGSTVFASTRAAVDQLTNQLIAALDTAASMRLGAPLGINDGGSPMPQRVESPYSDASLDDLRALLEGVEAIYTGGLDGRTGQGLGELVRWRSPGADTIVRIRTMEALHAVDSTPSPLREAIVREPARVQTALEAVRAWKRAIQVDVANLLGVAVTFTDNDGD